MPDLRRQISARNNTEVVPYISAHGTGNYAPLRPLRVHLSSARRGKDEECGRRISARNNTEVVPYISAHGTGNYAPLRPLRVTSPQRGEARTRSVGAGFQPGTTQRSFPTIPRPVRGSGSLWATTPTRGRRSSEKSLHRRGRSPKNRCQTLDGRFQIGTTQRLFPTIPRRARGKNHPKTDARPQTADFSPERHRGRSLRFRARRGEPPRPSATPPQRGIFVFSRFTIANLLLTHCSPIAHPRKKHFPRSAFFLTPL
jgi:hypothetical protein